MKKYLKSILLFDLAVPALLLGIPGIGLFLALTSFDSYADAKQAEFEQQAEQARQNCSASASAGAGSRPIAKIENRVIQP